MLQDRRELHNEELRNLYSSLNIVRVTTSRRMKSAGHVAPTGEMRRAYEILVRKAEGKRPFGRPRCTWEDNIKMDLAEIQYGVMDQIHVVQNTDLY
jgi:hypothetical protein